MSRRKRERRDKRQEWPDDEPREGLFVGERNDY